MKHRLGGPPKWRWTIHCVMTRQDNEPPEIQRAYEQGYISAEEYRWRCVKRHNAGLPAECYS